MKIAAIILANAAAVRVNTEATQEILELNMKLNALVNPDGSFDAVTTNTGTTIRAL